MLNKDEKCELLHHNTALPYSKKHLRCLWKYKYLSVYIHGVEFCLFVDIVCIFHCLKWAPGKWIMNTQHPLRSYAYIQGFTFKANIIFGRIFPGKVISRNIISFENVLMKMQHWKAGYNLSISKYKHAVSSVTIMYCNLQLTAFTIMENKSTDTLVFLWCAIIKITNLVGNLLVLV